MTDLRAIRLTARREISERFRSRAYRASTAALVLIVVGIVIVVGLIDDDGPSSYDVATVGTEAGEIAEVASSQAPGFDAELDLRTFEDEAEAIAAVEDEEVEIAILGGSRAVAGENPPDELVTLLETASQQVGVVDRLRDEGLSEPAITGALDPPPLEVDTVGGDGAGGEGLALLSGVILYMALIMAGLAVAQGVVEEKGSRVIELLLSAIKPIQLLAGKVLGIGLVGLFQVLLIAGSGIGTAVLSGLVELPGSTGETALLSVVFFVIGYLLYACAFAVAGAIVSRQEDLTGSTSLLTFVLVGAYLASIGIIGQPESAFAVLVTMLPPTAPMVVPVRAAQDALPLWQLGLSLVLTVGATFLLLWLAARIYERTVLRMGAPIKLTDALRLAR